LNPISETNFMKYIAFPIFSLPLSLLGLSIFMAPGTATSAPENLGVAAARAVTAQAPAASVARLRCEYMENPLGIDTAAPRLSWVIQGGARGWMQSAYRIQVASSAALLSAGKADLWDSRRVSSGQTLGVRYAGKGLGSGARAFWRVQVWGSNGRASSWSAPQMWQVGLLRASDWKAQWITAQTPRKVTVDGLKLPPPPYLRKAFTLAKPIRQATLYATARGVYELRLNGSRVSDQVLAPGWTDYRKRVQYQAYDVTRQLQRGPNAIGAILGDGWHSGYVGFSRQRDHYGDTTALLAQLDVQYTDGTRQLVSSDTSWQGGTGPISYSDMLMGESFDARRTQAAWDTARFSGAGWSPAIVAPAPGGMTVDVTAKLRDAIANNTLSIEAGNDIAGDPAYNVVKNLRVDYTINGVEKSRTLAEKETLQIPGPDETPGPLVIRRAVYGALDRVSGPAAIVGNRGPAVRVTQQLKPVKITQPTPSTWIYDMGQNMVGVVRLKVRGAAGTAVKMRFAEMLNPDGTAYTANLRAARATDTYICKGAGEEIWEPKFTFHGFRYVEVTGFPGTPGLDAITGLVIGSDTPKTGTFRSSSALVNQLQSNIDWGQRGNFLSVPTDCPQRDERLGWMGDAQVFVRTATYNRDVSSFFEKWMQDVEDGQTPDGGFPDVAPRKVDEANGAPAWGDAGVIVPWTIYQAYGDTEVVNKHWGAMERWMEYISSVNPNGLWLQRRSNDFGDWLSIAADTPKDVLATAYYAYDASLMAKMARATGRSAEAAKYDALFEKIKGAFNTAYVQPDGRVKGNTQTAYLVALRFNLLPQNLRDVAAKYLVDDIAAKNGHLSTGFVGVGYLCPVLSDAGHNDVAYKLLLNDTFPSWGYSIRQGATTIWERWDGWTEDKGFQDVGMNSFNHYSLGSVGEWLYRYVAGIDTDPDAPGFARIVIRPHPGPGLTFANASFDSVRGRIVSNWKQQGGQMTMDVTIPANTTATVYVPSVDAAQVKESGKSASASPGVAFLRQDGANVIFSVGSGTYTFTVPQTAL
jgi:alpha-L-rhamnosidase